MLVQNLIRQKVLSEIYTSSHSGGPGLHHRDCEGSEGGKGEEDEKGGHT